jgi:UDP-N-acetylglucosamine 1-carboxyvinyltransferase
MSEFVITGGKRLSGEVAVQGAKNSVLPILAASLLSSDETVLHNCPDLKDVDSAIAILDHLGCKAVRENNTIVLNNAGIVGNEIPEHLMREMRSSVIFLGAIIARMGSAKMSFPGGCELGPRPIDLHLAALRQLGVEIVEENGNLICHAGDMRGRDLHLSFPSVGATENAMLAATACKGRTRIFNPAREPEIRDLQDYLCRIGCKVSGAGESVVEIEGGQKTNGTEHTVIPDRIATGTYLCAAAATGSHILVSHAEPAHIMTLIDSLREAGCNISIEADAIEINVGRPLKAISPVRTMPYPGFATDIQSPLMAVMCKAQGVTMFVENIFENRYRHVGELLRMGADIKVAGRVAVVCGVGQLSGARVHATDLRGGAALVVAALGAEGVSSICNVAHIDRGYEKMEDVLAGLGADIRRIDS